MASGDGALGPPGVFEFEQRRISTPGMGSYLACLPGTGAGPVMFSTDGCQLPGVAMTGAATLRPPARFDASVVPGAKPAPFPGFIEPYHPALREEAPAGARWVDEMKFDGYRTQAHLRSGRPAIYTRAGYDWTLRFQPIADALAALPANSLIQDGEALVANLSRNN